MGFHQGIAILVLLPLIVTLLPQCDAANCVCFEEIAQGMVNPLVMEEPKDGSGRLFVTSQHGFIYIYYRNGSRLEEPFLDVSERLSNMKKRARGLIGSGLHPDFVENQRFFVYYTTKDNPDGIERATLSEFRVSADNPNKADPNSEIIMIEMKKFTGIHNGGQILFDSKKYLYLFNGDGGVQGDPDNNAQNKSELLGSVLRLDVSDPTVKYKIPPDNPFVDDPDARGEIYALGIRCAFSAGIDRGDRVTGYGKDRIFFGDVGWSKHEELSYLAPDGGGSNYGWRYWQGAQCREEANCYNITNYVPPTHYYTHAFGNAIIGGSFYRGCRYPGLNGVYFYGDHGFGVVWTLTENSTEPSGWLNENLNVCPDCAEKGFLPYQGGHVYGFAEDAYGELYLLSATTSEPLARPPGGRIFKFIDPSTHDTHTECSLDGVSTPIPPVKCGKLDKKFKATLSAEGEKCKKCKCSKLKKKKKLFEAACKENLEGVRDACCKICQKKGHI